MKKQILILIALVGLSLAVSAQIKSASKKDASIILKPGAEIKFQPTAEDTTIHAETYSDMNKRIQSVSNLMFLIIKPGDVTPNQRDGVLKNADSLLKVDIAQYNKIQNLKKKPVLTKP